MKNVILGIGIFIVFMLMLGYGVEAFYPQPDYEDYCDESLRAPFLLNEERAVAIDKGEFDACRGEYDDARAAWERVVFFIAFAVGIITLIVGYSILSMEPVGSALIASGIGSIFYGSVTNWRNFTDVWRFLMLVIALIFLIWLALRLNKKEKKKRNFWEFWK